MRHECVTSWPQIDDVLAELSRLYLPVQDGLGDVRPLGDTSARTAPEMQAGGQPWAFVAEIPFVRLVVEECPQFALVELEVLSGRIGAAVLSPDGSSYLGERHFFGRGRFILQLPVPALPARSVVLCNGGPGETGGRFRVHSSKLLRIDREGPSFTRLRRLLEEEASRLPPEVDRPEDVGPSLPLAFFRLLGCDRTHEAGRLWAAISHVRNGYPPWLPMRLAEILTSCPVESRPEVRPAGTASPAPAPEPAALPGPVIEEVIRLRQMTAGSLVVPLHLELLETLLTLDLLSVVRPCRVRFQWSRPALTATPVARGILCELLLLIVERVAAEDPMIEIDVATTPEGTTVCLRSPLDPGALQYRAHSVRGETLQRCLQVPGSILPEIEHRLSAERELRVTWKDRLVPASQPSIQFSRDSVPSARELYSNHAGGVIRLLDGICYKVAPSTSIKPAGPMEEAEMLRSLAGRRIVPDVLAAVRFAGVAAMSYKHVPGLTLLDWASTSPPAQEITRVLLQLGQAVAELNRQGIQHRDLRAENILLTDSGRICLIDFDQARRASPADDFGNEWASNGICAGFGSLLRQLEWRLPYLRVAGHLGFAWHLGRLSSANSPGKHSCYYSWHWGGYELSGERPWNVRWDLLRPLFERELPPGRFLELGCNLGLLSTHAGLCGWQAVGIDQNALAVAAAELVSNALSATARFQVGDLCHESTYTALENQYDLVSVLSVVHWLPNPAPIEKFLRSLPRLLFEGHRSLHDEMAYLRSLGYDDIRCLGYSERLRPVFYACKF